MSDNTRQNARIVGTLLAAIFLFLFVALAGCGTQVEAAKRVETVGTVTLKYEAPSTDYFEVTVHGVGYDVSVSRETYNTYEVGDQIDVALYVPVNGGPAWLMVLR